MAAVDGVPPDATYQQMADQFLDELAAAGLALVPTKATPEMMKAWRDASAPASPKATWRIMVSAVTGRLINRENDDGNR